MSNSDQMNPTVKIFLISYVVKLTGFGFEIDWELLWLGE